ncbi:hypothetical protein PV325_008550 [Microctonus aethiopoides]|uniref:NADH dehydrogenase [ubiquinone] iron-sulfur protein 6, mitochondrial n=1 Tax=Microctonus aethiopoides TaxID=144406 RepID=A0AA39KLA9_9HYME|nr:hypothetical protein PV325_008550 [Microctonus aethiopoides]KAK0165567.1 hypothetical protein PV328_004072 [Microctonus aethiopoides]
MAGKNISLLLRNSGKSNRKTPVVTKTSRTNVSWQAIDIETHTGQKFDIEDKRLVRFVDKVKEVNKQWAIGLIDQVPPESSNNRIVSCNGNGGPLGHPKVYINLDKPGNHTCGYCGLRFHKDHHH